MTKRFIVLAGHSDTAECERYGCDTFGEAVEKRDELLKHGYGEVIVTEYVPLRVVDGREKPPVIPVPMSTPNIPWWPNSTPPTPAEPYITWNTVDTVKA